MQASVYLMFIVYLYVCACVCAISSYCLSSEDTCHPLPGPALPTLLQFHTDLLAFSLKLFQGELHSISTW